MSIAIVGAGMAGLSCAEALVEAGHDVRLFDKGRGPGGRMSARRAQTPLGELRFDHGAQFFTARDEAFLQRVSCWIECGAAAEWKGRVVDVDADGAVTPSRQDTRYVGVPGMNGVIRDMADGLDVTWRARVARVSEVSGGWMLSVEDGPDEGPFESVIIAVPAEQAVDLLKDAAPDLSSRAASVVSAPCWAVMLAFDQPLQKEWDAARFADGPVSWAARNASKPARATTETWVLHASPDWSRAHLEDEQDAVADALTAAFVSSAPVAVYSAAHRWRYAQVEMAPEASSPWDNDLKIGICGDWTIGPRVEAAWRSGRDVAAAIARAEK